MPGGAWVTTQFFDTLGRLRKSLAVSVLQAGTNIEAAVTDRDGTAAANPTNPGTDLVLAPGKAGGIDSNGNFQCWTGPGDYEVWAGSTYIGSFTVGGGGGGSGLALGTGTPTTTVPGGHAAGVGPTAAPDDHAHDLGAHHTSHASAGTDAIAPADIGAAAASDVATGDANTLALAETYADSHDATTLTSAHSYADSGDAATLASAEAYTDAHTGTADTYQSRIAKRTTFQ